MSKLPLVVDTSEIDRAFAVLEQRVHTLEQRDTLHSAQLDELIDRVATLEGSPVPDPIPTPPPQPTPGLKRPLAKSDFTYRGRRQVKIDGAGDVHYGFGLTHRYVGDELRIFTLGFKGNVPGNPTKHRLVEFRLVGEEFQVVRLYEEPWGEAEPLRSINTGEHYHGLFWDEANNGLWTGSAVDYATHEETEPSIVFRRLNDDGTVRDLQGPWSVAGEGATHTFGGLAKTPFGYVTGFGGYTSRMDAGIPASLGPCAYAIEDPLTLPPGMIPRRELVDHSSGDRGVRNLDYVNYFDGADPRQNPHTEPTDPPLPGPWQPPFPDGLGRFCWGDATFDGDWVEINDAEGLVFAATLGSGDLWYGDGTLHCDRATFELQIYSRDSMVGGNVKPTERFEIQLEGRGNRQNYGPGHGISGVSYDSKKRELLLYSAGGPIGYDCWVFVFGVGP